MVASSTPAPLVVALGPALRRPTGRVLRAVRARLGGLVPPRHRTAAVVPLDARRPASLVLAPSRLVVTARVADPEGDASGAAAGVTLRIATARAAASAHLIEGAWVRHDWNGALVGRRFLTPWADPRDEDRHDDARSLVWRRDRVRVTLPRRAERVPDGILLAGLWSRVWGHWIVDVLPRLLLAERLPAHLAGLPLLVPYRTLGRDRFREALATLADPARAIELPRDAAVRVDRLVLLDGGRDLVAARAGEPPMTALRARLLAELRERVRREVGAPDRPEPGRRLLLVRSTRHSDAPHRRIDEAALRALADEHGLEPVALETLPFAEQVRTVASAEALVGVTGSAWTAALFANPGTRGLIVRSDAFPDAWIPTVTTLGGVATRVLTVPSDPAREAGAAIDPRALAAAWRRTVGAPTRAAAPARAVAAA